MLRYILITYQFFAQGYIIPTIFLFEGEGFVLYRMWMVTTPSVWTNSLNDVCSCMGLHGLRTFTPYDRTQPLDVAEGV